MTSAQWLWEFESLKEKEKEETEKIIEVIKAFKNTLIKLLGLDLLTSKLDTENEDEEELSSMFVPMSLMVSRREVAEKIFKNMEDEKVLDEVVKDEEFEKMSEAAMRGENIVGDMEPVIRPATNLNKLVDEETLKSIGVNIVDRKPTATSHIKFDNTDAKNKYKELINDLEHTRKSVSHQLTEEKKELEPRGVTVKFDDHA